MSRKDEAITQVQEELEKLPKEESSCRKAFCAESLKDQLYHGLKAINERKPSALVSLDGLRAIAILWVVSHHWMRNLCRFFKNGDLGVDLFFILSGFLMAFVLLKEQTKHGSIDYWQFYCKRFIRIWPALFVYKLIELVLHPSSLLIKSMFVDLSFLTNLVPIRETHLWSVSVEYQMYFISPFVITSMTRHGPYVAPILLILLSIALNFLVIVYFCPESLRDPHILGIEHNEVCEIGETWFWLYAEFYTRMGPYFLGMIAAYWHLNLEKAPTRRVELEVSAVSLIVYIAIQGAGGATWYPGVILWMYRISSRVIFATCWAYLMPGLLSIDEIASYFPTKHLRRFLSANFWVPIATISYSFYLIHQECKYAAMKTFPKIEGETALLMTIGRKGCEIFMAVATSILGASLIFILVERPCNNARSLLKNRHVARKIKLQKETEVAAAKKMRFDSMFLDSI